jgi:hypothetical protein
LRNVDRLKEELAHKDGITPRPVRSLLQATLKDASWQTLGWRLSCESVLTTCLPCFQAG